MSKSARNRAQRSVLNQPRIAWGAIAFFTLVGLLAAVAIGYAFVQSRSGPSEASIKGLVERNGLSREHTDGAVQYDTMPPMGGDHDPLWQNCDSRVYDRPLRDENAVHSLEHGAVWITYQPYLAAEQIDRLGDTVERTRYTMMSPYPGQDAPIILTAWGRQLKVKDASDPRIDAFLRAFVLGPQTPEPGASCSDGKDVP